ncbi:hypothetical protein KJ891_04715 [Candidatus Micrarchaeota archaeon]|nr:hypothetical protein [Candidatus Micrarchaeota archaeon]
MKEKKEGSLALKINDREIKIPFMDGHKALQGVFEKDGRIFTLRIGSEVSKEGIFLYERIGGKEVRVEDAEFTMDLMHRQTPPAFERNGLATHVHDIVEPHYAATIWGSKREGNQKAIIAKISTKVESTANFLAKRGWDEIRRYAGYRIFTRKLKGNSSQNLYNRHNIKVNIGGRERIIRIPMADS